MRVGTGYDLHRMVEGRPFYLGGVIIPSEKGEEAHSDGDVLLHALIDAVLGSCADGDIGSHFPPEDDKWKDADSRMLLKAVLDDTKAEIINIDATVFLERPKLRPHVDEVRASLAALLGLDIKAVSLKAKTVEGCLGELGTGDAVAAAVTILVNYRRPEGLRLVTARQY